MFYPDQAHIRHYATGSPTHLFRVGVFVQATINRHFEQVQACMHAYDAEGLDASWLSAQQRQALEALAYEAPRLHACLPQWYRGKRGLEACLHAWTACRGFGIVKAAFMAQLILPPSLYGGCLDRHHLRRVGLHERTFERTPASAEALTQRIATYMATCKSLGGSARLWNAWCETLAMLRPQVWPTAAAVSAYHVACIMPQDTHPEPSEGSNAWIPTSRFRPQRNGWDSPPRPSAAGSNGKPCPIGSSGDAS